MMADAIGYEEWVAMLRGAARRIQANQGLLSKLDSFGGDGDHGSTMARAMGKLEEAVDGGAENLAALFRNVGWAIMGVDGGATGPLLGTLFMSMGEAAGTRQHFDCAGLAVLLEAGLAGIRKRTRADVGDKTMVDALAPAVAAVRDAVNAGKTAAEALADAAEAAQRGAERTRDMQARFGRAKNLREKSVGERDPGAVSMSLIFRGFWEGASENA